MIDTATGAASSPSFSARRTEIRWFVGRPWRGSCSSVAASELAHDGRGGRVAIVGHRVGISKQPQFTRRIPAAMAAEHLLRDSLREEGSPVHQHFRASGSRQALAAPRGGARSPPQAPAEQVPRAAASLAWMAAASGACSSPVVLFQIGQPSAISLCVALASLPSVAAPQQRLVGIDQRLLPAAA